MANTFTKVVLSGSSSGKMVPISASATPGTVIHTAVSGSTILDEIWLYGTSRHTYNVPITFEWGGTSDADLIPLSIDPASGFNFIIPGLPLNNGLVVRAYVSGSSFANLVNIGGFVNRITPG
jgi:hypothetical protein